MLIGPLSSRTPAADSLKEVKPERWLLLDSNMCTELRFELHQTPPEYTSLLRTDSVRRRSFTGSSLLPLLQVWVMAEGRQLWQVLILSPAAHGVVESRDRTNLKHCQSHIMGRVFYYSHC